MSDKRRPFFFNDEIRKAIRQTGKFALEEAKENGTHIVYKDKNGYIVRKYPNGRIVKESKGEDY